MDEISKIQKLYNSGTLSKNGHGSRQGNTLRIFYLPLTQGFLTGLVHYADSRIMPIQNIKIGFQRDKTSKFIFDYRHYNLY